MHPDWKKKTTIPELVKGIIDNAGPCPPDGFKEDVKDCFDRAVEIALCGGHPLLKMPKSGVSLRDYFATHIDPGVTFNTPYSIESFTGTKPPSFEDAPTEFMKYAFEAKAKLRYMQADAMMRERARQK